MKNTLLAETLKKISKLGRKGFYEGEIANKMVSYLKSIGGHQEVYFCRNKQFWQLRLICVFFPGH